VHFTDGTVRTIDTILYATGFKASLPFLDPSPLQMADGVPLRVGGMTLPVGLERLYFVGLAAPRGPQLPVYSAQARLIAKFLTDQERSGFALSAIHAKASRPEARIDIPRHEWRRDMDHTLRRTCRILRRTPTRASAPQPSRDSLGDPRMSTRLAG
jgi:flavin-binding monooxygenase-like protein